ncbi:MAG: rod shape-determining protein [Alphaproteobacteria bacterium]|nr:rod shape-determining protein [Alphaproteobacteria bacterium]MCB9793507.1 rod shape-determining protein [Alphaproteobacteria bacterium]
MVSGVLSGVLGALSQDVAVDLGSATTRIALKGKGVVCREPSAVAVRSLKHRGERGGRRILEVGEGARVMLGRTPRDIEVVRPIRDSVIADFEVTEAMLRELMLRSLSGQILGPRVTVCIPHGTSEVERRAMRECAEAAGARGVLLLDQPLAAALGAGLDVTAPQGCMVVDVGAGTTEVAVIALSGVVQARTVRVGGDQLDEAIVHHLREARGLLIGPLAAEELKLELGSAVPPRESKVAVVRGREISSGYPRARRVSAAEVHEALTPNVRMIVDTVLATLHKTPPELAADITDTGLLLTGAGAQLAGLEQALREACGVPVVVADAPADAVVRGAERALGDAVLLDALAG